MTANFPTDFPSKNTPVDADQLLLADSEDGNESKSLSISDLKSVLPGIWDVTAAANLWDNLLIRWDWATKWVQNSWISVDDSWNLSGVDWIDIDLTPISTTHTPWRIRYNEDEYTLDFDWPLWNTLQIGQEVWVPFHNNTGFTIWDGKVVRANWFTIWNLDTVDLVKSDNIDNISWILFVTTTPTLDWEDGMMTIFGKVSDVNTTWLTVWDPLYISATTAWDLTTTKPVFPNYTIQMGIVLSVWASGKIGISQNSFPKDTFINAWDGTIRETFDFRVSSDWATITGTFQNDDLTNDLTMVFSEWLEMFDCTPAATITLTAWTATNPQENYVYIPMSTKVLTLSTTWFPWTSEEYIRVAFLYLRDAVTTQTDDWLINQNLNDHVKATDNNWHMAHITERVRTLPAEWMSWVAWTSTIWWGSTIDVSNTSWVVLQLHEHTFPALDTALWDEVHVVNDFTTAYRDTSDLETQVTDALWNTLTNSSYSFVMWWVQNKSWEVSHLMINVPTGTYAKNSPSDAVNDALNYSVYDIPKQFKSVWFLIARFTYTLNAGGTTWTLEDTQDLRGKIPNTTAGWGGWGGWVIDFTALIDTPSSYTGQAGLVTQVNSWETALEFIDKNAETATLTNKTLTSPVINVTSDATWDIYYRNAWGLFTRLPVGTAWQILTLASWIPSWADSAWGWAVSVLNTFTQAWTVVSATYGTWIAWQGGTMTEFNAGYVTAPTWTAATIEIFKNAVSMGTITISAWSWTQATLTGATYVKFDKFHYVVTEGGTIAGAGLSINAITS